MLARILLIFLSLCLLLVFVFLFLDERPGDDLGDTLAPVPVARQKREPISASDPVVEPARTTEHETPAAEDAEEGRPAVELTYDQLEVRCIDARSGAVVPGAILKIQLSRGGALASHLERNGAAPETLASLPAIHADGEGRALFRHESEAGRVYAQAGELWGEADFEGLPHETGLTISMSPLKRIDLLVLDDQEQPCPDVAVRWRVRSPVDSATFRYEHAARTDTRGRARLPVSVAPKSQWHAYSYAVALDGLFLPPEELTVDPDRLPEEELVLHMRPQGSVEIDLVTTTGEPLGDGGNVQLGIAGARTTSFSTLSAPILAGRARFDSVGLGLALAVITSGSDGRRFDVVRQEFQGPVEAGEVVHLRMELKRKPEAYRVSGVLLDPAGRPLGGTRLGFRIERPSLDLDGYGHLERPTDAEGRFELELQSGSLPPPDDLLFEIHPLSGAHAGRTAERRLGRDLKPGLNDLDSLLLDERRLIVAGRVVNEEGQALSGAGLLVFGCDEDGRQTPRYSRTPALMPRCDREGRFAVFGRATTPRISLQATGDHPSEDWMTFDAGTEDALVVVTRRGGVQGELVCPEICKKAGVQLRFHPEDGGKTRGRTLFGGPFDMKLPAGGYRGFLSLGDRETGVRLAEVPSFRVEPGNSLDLGRIAVEVPGLICALNFELAEPKLEIISYRILDHASQKELRSGTLMPGRAVAYFQVDELPVIVEARASGHRLLRDLVSEPVSLKRLERGYPVPLRIHCEVPIPSGYELVAFFPAEGDLTRPGLMQARSEHLRTPELKFVLHAESPGQCVLYIGLAGKKSGAREMVSLFESGRTCIEVRDAGEPESQVISVTAAQLEQAVATLEGR